MSKSKFKRIKGIKNLLLVHKGCDSRKGKKDYYNYRTKAYMNKDEAKRCCCEDFMPSKNGVIEEPLYYLDTDTYGNKILARF
jgi:hypothetical protein|tara:strand:- start:1141 stop:1386 length:246 start_codon:yes stop_codon:yes gene_type:complete